ncbi:hypothetical protein GE21DRAFT_1113340 [Neurospora crassa]|nr:hypothetical protein GE21DRAFT_1113340 [Neurospora crassa]
MSLPPSMPPSRTRCWGRTGRKGGQLMELMSTDEHASKVCGRNLVMIVGCSVTYLLLPTVGYLVAFVAHFFFCFLSYGKLEDLARQRQRMPCTRDVMFQSQRPLNLYAGHVKCNV